MERVTVKQIAEAAGVSTGTASYALRGSKFVSSKTAEKVKKVAQELGYMPDPSIGMAMSAIRKGRIVGHGDKLAFITAFEKKESWHHKPIMQNYWLGALDRASELGYILENYWLGEEGVSEKRHSQILYSRGIRGLLLAPHPNKNAVLNLNWKNFATVAISRSIARPEALHRVLDDHYFIMSEAMRGLRKQGYKRIGFAMSNDRIDRVDGLWLGSYLYNQQKLASEDRIPPCYERVAKTGNPDRPGLVEWFQTYRPDSILGIEHKDLKILEKAGWTFPKHFGYAHINLLPTVEEYGGVVHDAFEVGVSAINQLVSMIRNKDYGLPKKRKITLVEGYWKDGPSAPLVNHD